MRRSAAWKIRRRPRVFASIFAVYLILSIGTAALASQRLHARSGRPRIVAMVRKPAVHPPKYLVLMVLDGARPDYFGRVPLPHIDALRARGTQFSNALDGILETETPSGHATLATGTTPARNGILGFDWARDGKSYSLFSPDVVRSGAIERIFAGGRVPTIAGLYKRKYFKSLVVAISGHKYYAADPLGGPAADAIMYYQGDSQGHYVPVAVPGHSPPPGVLTAPGVTGPNTHLGLTLEDHLATKLALASFARMHQRITLINYPEFDWPLGHIYGGDESPARVVKLMRGLDKDLGMIEEAYRKAGVLNQTLFVLTADHGMGTVKRFIPDTEITSATLAAGTTAANVTYATGAYIWLSNPSRAKLVAQNLAGEHDPGIQSVYYRDRSSLNPSYQLVGSPISPRVDAANQYLLETLVNGHEPSVVALCRFGNSFITPTTNWKGDHGGAGWSSQHIPLIMAGPGIRRGVVRSAPAQLDDIAPTVLHVMGVRPTGMDGQILTDVLTQREATLSPARQAEIQDIVPVVNALKAQEQAEKIGPRSRHIRRSAQPNHRAGLSAR